LFHAIRLLEKEYNSVFKLVSSFQGILASIEETSAKVESDLVRLEEAFEEKARLNACRDEERALLEDESDLGITKILKFFPQRSQKPLFFKIYPYICFIMIL